MITKYFGGPLEKGYIFLLKVEGNNEEEIINGVDNAIKKVNELHLNDYVKKSELLDDFLNQLNLKHKLNVIEESKLFRED